MVITFPFTISTFLLQLLCDHTRLSSFFGITPAMLDKYRMGHMFLKIQEQDQKVPQDPAAIAKREVYQVARYLDILTGWLQRSPTARRTFVSLFSYADLVRNHKARELYKSASFSSFEVSHPFDRYIFTSRHSQHLRQMQTQYETQYQKDGSDALFLAGDSNDLAQGIVGENLFFQSIVGDVPAPTVVFINPNDLRLQWRTMEALSQLSHAYVILFYPLDSLNRHMPRTIQGSFTTEVDLFFGTRQWRELYLKALGRNKQRILLPYYMDRLRGLGFREVTCMQPTVVSHEEEDASLYCLLFAHKQPMSPAFWEELVTRPFRPRRDDTAPFRALPTIY